MIDLLKKNMLKGFLTLAVVFVFGGFSNMVAYASEAITLEAGEEGIFPYSDIIEYRYKVVDGDVYRRLYNYSKECWVGEWELCAKGHIEPGV